MRTKPVMQFTKMPAWSEGYRMKIKYADVTMLTSGTSSPVQFQFRLNAPIDPNASSGVAGTAAGWQVLERMWSKQLTYACKITQTFTHLGPEEDYYIVYQIYTDDETPYGVPTSTNSIRDYYSMDKYGGAALLVAATNNAAKPRTFKNFVSMRRLFATKGINYDISYQSPMNTTPSNLAFMDTWIVPTDFAVTAFTNNVFVKTKITFYVTLMGRRDPYDSFTGS